MARPRKKLEPLIPLADLQKVVADLIDAPKAEAKEHERRKAPRKTKARRT